MRNNDDETEPLVGGRSRPSESTQPLKLEPLTGEQVNYAREVIEKRKRLAGMQLSIVWPFLRYIFCCCISRRKNFREAMKRSLRKKMALRISKSDTQIEEDPYLLLGFGMNSYFDIMLNLFCMMVLASFFAVPLMIIFSRYEALSQTQYGFHIFSMGNMGGAESICQIAQA